MTTRTRNCRDIARAVFAETSTERHVVYFSMVATQPSAKGKDVLGVFGGFSEQMETEIGGGSDESVKEQVAH